MSEFFTINLPDEYINIMNEIKIDKNMDPFSKFHDPSISIEENTYNIIYESIKDVSNHNSEKLAKKCAKIIDKILQLCITKLSQNMNINKYHKLVWLRYGTVKDDFDIPRWHWDGNYNMNNQWDKMSKDEIQIQINQKKIIVSLIGPGTLIAKCSNSHNKEVIAKIEELDRKYPRYVNNELNTKNAKLIQKKLSKSLDSCTLHQLDNFEGAIYNVGIRFNKEGNCCVHSEPKFDKPRLFLALVLSEIQ